MDKNRRKYTKEFKQEAVRLVTVGGRSMTEIAESLRDWAIPVIKVG
jgi:transposase-like protein